MKVINDLSKPYVKPGDKLFGQLILTCLNCKTQRYYWLFWVVGEGGWYREIPENSSKGFPFSFTDTPNESEMLVEIDRAIPKDNRINFFANYEGMRRGFLPH